MFPSTPVLAALALLIVGALVVALGLAARSQYLEVPDQPIPPRRRKFLFIGLPLLAAGLLWLTVQGLRGQPVPPPPDGSMPPVQMVSASFMVDDWNPYLIDWRTATHSGIPVASGQSLRIYDVWVSVPAEASGYDIYADVFAPNGEKIGTVGAQPAVAGPMPLEGISIDKHPYPGVENAWKVQADWQQLTIFFYVFDGDKELSRSMTTLKLDPDGTSWLLLPPYAEFISMQYSINSGSPQTMDLSRIEEAGLSLVPGDQISITGIEYRARTGTFGHRIQAEAYVSSGGYDSASLRSSPFFYQEPGVHAIPDFDNFTWTIEPGKTAIVITLSSDDRGVLDRYEIPINGQAQ